MDRYTVESVDPYDMEPAPYGMWVMHDDANAAIDAAVAAERERWESALSALMAVKWCTPEYEQACRAAAALLKA